MPNLTPRPALAATDETTENRMPHDVKWTAHEAMACAYCWAEFTIPETRGDDPVAYWLGITEAARNSCRRVANQKWLLAVARGQAVAVTSPHMLTEAERAAIGAEVGIKAPARIWKIIMAVMNGAAKRPAVDGARPHPRPRPLHRRPQSPERDMSDDRLLPCPFCGGEAELSLAGYPVSDYVHCKECGTEGPGYNTKADAIAAWNRRERPMEDVTT